MKCFVPFQDGKILNTVLFYKVIFIHGYHVWSCMLNLLEIEKFKCGHINVFRYF